MEKELKLVNAGCSSIMPYIVRAAIIGTGRKPEKAKMHPAQVAAVADLYEAVAVESIPALCSLEDIDAVRHLAKEYQPSTLMGMVIEQDVSMPMDRMEFLDAKGELISCITSLAIPNGFYETPQAT